MVKESARLSADVMVNRIMTTQKTLTLKQVKSPIGRPKDQTATLIGLRLNKMNRTSTIIDTPENRGMIQKVAHLIQIVE